MYFLLTLILFVWCGVVCCVVWFGVDDWGIAFIVSILKIARV